MAQKQLTICDLTQSWSSTGGGIRTYLAEKRAWLTRNTPHRQVLIVPGETDRINADGRHVTVEIRSPAVPGSPAYKLLLRNKAVIRALRNFRPDVIECLDAYNLPWAALAYRKERPKTVLVAGYRTDFPAVYLGAPIAKPFGRLAAASATSLGYRYVADLYRRFDGIYALSHRMAARLSDLTRRPVEQMPLGVDAATFRPDARSTALRERFGVAPDAPLLISVGRLDREKRADLVVDAFARLPKEMAAVLVLLGQGNLVNEIQSRARAEGLAIHLPGFITERGELAKHLASADLYVSAMAHETFGISIIEAQSCALPVIGVAGGAMVDRVSPSTGRLARPGDAAGLAQHIQEVWRGGLATVLGMAAREHALEHFGWDRTFQHLLETIYPRARDRAIRRLAEIGSSGETQPLSAAPLSRSDQARSRSGYSVATQVQTRPISRAPRVHLRDEQSEGCGNERSGIFRQRFEDTKC